MTITQRIKRIEELRREGIDWSEMDRAMYGPLPQPERLSPFAKRLAEKRLAPIDRSQWLHDGCGPDGRSAWSNYPPRCARCGHDADWHEHEDDEGVATRIYFSWCRKSWADPNDATMEIECDCAGYADWVPSGDRGAA